MEQFPSIPTLDEDLLGESLTFGDLLVISIIMTIIAAPIIAVLVFFMLKLLNTVLIERKHYNST